MKKIIHSTHPLLRKHSLPVEKNDNLIKQLILALEETMKVNRAQSISAVKIGVLKRVIIINSGGFEQEFINPYIVKKYGGLITVKEGCISYPGKTPLIIRSKQVIIEGYNKDWELISRKLKGKAAICAQHEVDHLDGITITSKRE